MIIVAGTVPIRPEKHDEAVDAAIQMAEATRAEAGCITYGFYSDLANPNLILVYEEWESEVALDLHMETDHMHAFRAKLPDLLAGEPDITRYNAEAASG